MSGLGLGKLRECSYEPQVAAVDVLSESTQLKGYRGPLTLRGR